MICVMEECGASGPNYNDSWGVYLYSTEPQQTYNLLSTMLPESAAENGFVPCGCGVFAIGYEIIEDVSNTLELIGELHRVPESESSALSSEEYSILCEALIS